jgi:hypothetical protein
MFDVRHRYAFFQIKCVIYHFLRPRLGLLALILGDDTPNRGHVMDAKYFREKAELCLRLADGLSLNNPGRFQLMDLADDFLERAKELEAQIQHEAA